MKKISQARLAKLQGNGRAAKKKAPEPSIKVTDSQIVNTLRETLKMLLGNMSPPAVNPAQPTEITAPIQQNFESADNALSLVRKLKKQSIDENSFTNLYFERNERNLITGAVGDNGEVALSFDYDANGFLSSINRKGNYLAVNRDEKGNIVSISNT